MEKSALISAMIGVFTRHCGNHNNSFIIKTILFQHG